MRRSEVAQEITWNLKDLFSTEEEFEKEVERLIEDGKKLEGQDLVKMTTDQLADLLTNFENFMVKSRLVSTYAYLDLSVDRTNNKLQKRQGWVNDIISELSTKLSYLATDIQKVDEDKLQKLALDYPQFSQYVRELLRDRPDRKSVV